MSLAFLHIISVYLQAGLVLIRSVAGSPQTVSLKDGQHFSNYQVIFFVVFALVEHITITFAPKSN